MVTFNLKFSSFLIFVPIEINSFEKNTCLCFHNFLFELYSGKYLISKIWFGIVNVFNKVYLKC